MGPGVRIEMTTSDSNSDGMRTDLPESTRARSSNSNTMSGEANAVATAAGSTISRPWMRVPTTGVPPAESTLRVGAEPVTPLEGSTIVGARADVEACGG